ncbi:hypothetical protein EJ03DRAFT_86200 [Teratosphaeria nubilosa]|uniref:Uncharacterized protein n=1 Tax=Teratosphaeria nubilosa TaxID=161662 RepID=A0A6G1LAD1_9PEZI|nr:hypothetical protein EJ03DRAFT_86200 [Teratosphaeria nubilosa]
MAVRWRKYVVEDQSAPDGVQLIRSCPAPKNASLVQKKASRLKIRVVDGILQLLQRTTSESVSALWAVSLTLSKQRLALALGPRLDVRLGHQTHVLLVLGGSERALDLLERLRRIRNLRAWAVLAEALVALDVRDRALDLVQQLAPLDALHALRSAEGDDASLLVRLAPGHAAADLVLGAFIDALHALRTAEGDDAALLVGLGDRVGVGSGLAGLNGVEGLVRGVVDLVDSCALLHTLHALDTAEADVAALDAASRFSMHCMPYAPQKVMTPPFLCGSAMASATASAARLAMQC